MYCNDQASSQVPGTGVSQAGPVLGLGFPQIEAGDTASKPSRAATELTAAGRSSTGAWGQLMRG